MIDKLDPARSFNFVYRPTWTLFGSITTFYDSNTIINAYKIYHVYRKTGTLPLICQKNQSLRYLNDEVSETANKEWNSSYVMDAKMNTTSNYTSL